MTPLELGENLARLVWESFSDFIAEETRSPASDPDGSSDPKGARDAIDEASAEEALIFFMWAHTRGTQLAFIGRADEDLVRRGLDNMHRAVFEDMFDHGTPRSQLPIFEQRASTRYSEYAAAAEVSDAALGHAVVKRIGASGDPARSALEIAERALEVANPLRDFLEEVELVD